MDIHLVSTLDSARDYLKAALGQGADLPGLWRKHMIDPYWEAIAQWAPFDHSHMQPTHVRRLDVLGRQLDILSGISLAALGEQFAGIAAALPREDGDPMIVALYPLCDGDRVAKERQNGVVGACVFGNIVLRVNPLAGDYRDWIPFVFAHEYHHCVWGHQRYVLGGGRGLEGSFLEYMLTEGQADAFAASLFPDLSPAWNRPFDGETEARLWEKMEPILFATEGRVHEKYMFGDEAGGLPWCAGYAFGLTIVGDYLGKHPGTPFADLIHVPAREMLRESRFGA